MILLGIVAACDVERPRASDEPCVVTDGSVCSRIHPPGILERSSPDFHGAVLREALYDTARCQTCHGKRLDEGGTSGKSCNSCHADGAFACITCHADLPQQGAHAAHLRGKTVREPASCAPCHLVPEGLGSIGHIFDAQRRLDPPPVEIALTFDPITKGCSDTICHGKQDPAPRWDTPHQPLGCQRCHGLPPPTPPHLNDRCESCHPRVSTSTSAPIDGPFHMDGRVDLGRDGSGGCEGCHPTAELDPVHQSHLTAGLQLSAPKGCESCHRVPEAVLSVGHIDSAPPVEVFPPGHGGVAWSRGAQPVWDQIGCSGTACHGVANTIEWRPQPIVCGSCHAIPPNDAAHPPPMTVRDCARCHVYGPSNVELHIDGKVDLR